MKEDNSDTLTDDKCVVIVRKLAKQRRDSIDAYDSAGRQDLADVERAELAVIEEYLPQLADEATVRGWVEAAIAATGATDKSGLGRVMGMVMGQHKGDVDGGLVRKLVMELLG